MGQTMDDDVAILAPAPVAEGAPTGDGVAHLRTSLPSSTPTIGGSLRPGRFGVILAAITIGALSLRVGYVLAVTRHQNGKLYDSFWYYSTTIGLRSGQFFREPFSFSPSAAHPPMTSLLLGAAAYMVGLHGGIMSSLLVMAVLGAAVVLCVGLLGRAVAGPSVGLTAAGLAAIAPNFWIPSGILMSETPAMLFMALILLAGVHLIRTPTVGAAVLLGLACGAETLVRAELILFVPGLLIPATLIARGIPLRRRLVLLGAGVAATTLVLAPWVGRNLATFKDATYISTGDGLALLGSNCPQTYSGPEIGLWSLHCATSIKGGGDESVQSSRDQHAALQYVEHHADRLPIVMLARVGREWDLYKPVQMAHVEAGEGRPFAASLAGLGFYYALLPFSVAGIIILRRRRIDQWFLLVPAAVVTLVSALVIALVRYRAPFEVCLVVLAAPGMVLLAQRLRGRPSSVSEAPAAAGPGPGESSGEVPHLPYGGRG
jgi:4-amino-4-deoxy-L-arabinose transferase-like glycosyltransferase